MLLASTSIIFLSQSQAQEYYIVEYGHRISTFYGGLYEVVIDTTYNWQDNKYSMNIPLIAL